MYTVYILYSEDLSRYYVGYTSVDARERLSKHVCLHKGYTSKASDWVIVKTFGFNNRNEAIKLEKYIKKRGARRYLESLI